MKRIKFKSYRTPVDSIFVSLMILTMIVGVYYYFIVSADHLIAKTGISSSLFLNAILLFRQNFSWNVVMRRKKGVMINLGGWVSKFVHYDDIRDFTIEGNTLKIKRVLSDTLTFDVSDYPGEDIEKLQALLTEQTQFDKTKMYHHR